MTFFNVVIANFLPRYIKGPNTTLSNGNISCVVWGTMVEIITSTILLYSDNIYIIVWAVNI